jgi:hypothetical protein
MCYYHHVNDVMKRIKNCVRLETKHYAMFFNKHVLSFGENDEKKHAEIHAIEKLDHQKIKKSVNLLVVRLSKSGELGESRPCYHCLQSLKKTKIKIKYVYFSTESKIITREKFKNMLCVNIFYVSSGHKICKNMIVVKKNRTSFIIK